MAKYTKDDYLLAASTLDFYENSVGPFSEVVTLLDACNYFEVSKDLVEDFWDESFLLLDDSEDYENLYPLATQLACEKAGL